MDSTVIWVALGGFLYYVFFTEKEKRTTIHLVVLFFSCILELSGTVILVGGYANVEPWMFTIILSIITTLTWGVFFLSEYSRIGKAKDKERINARYNLFLELNGVSFEKDKKIKESWAKELADVDYY